MSLYRFDILALLSEFENESYLAEALLFPEISRFESHSDGALKNLRDSLPEVLDGLSNSVYHTRRVPLETDLISVMVEVKPVERDITWKSPLPITFQAVAWRQGSTHHAFFPSLTIEVIADSAEELQELMPSQILSELQRQGIAESLSHLIWYQRTPKLTLRKTEVELHVESPRRRAEKLHDKEPDRAVLKEVATDLTLQELPEAFELDKQVARLAELLIGSHGRSVLLVGPSGVGKTAIAHQLVRKRQDHQLASTKFWETTGARLMVGADAFGDWQERCRHVVTEASAERAVLLLGNLFELAEVARHSTSPQGMAGYFRPYIERGELLCVVESTPEQRDLLERDHPHLLKAFTVLPIEIPDSQTARRILSSKVDKHRVSTSALESTDLLHRRFARYSAYPGRPLRFLEELVREHEGRIDSSQVAQSFSRETGLPQFIIDDTLPLDLERSRRFFRTRVMGQEEASDLVVDLIASVKANLSPPGRPIASLLFIGPTGVGKTEMARTIAQFLFQNRHRMVRFDMSEYADPYSVQRLVSGQGGGQGLLTGKVREQPFAVVLFDELEKADPSFFDLLLGILGEGRLTDEGGRLADFTNTVVVMTSNLGASNFHRGPLGFRTGNDDHERVRKEFTGAVKAAFRPELFNRIDRLVPFSPLTREVTSLVAAREVERLRERDGLRSEKLHLRICDDVTLHLAELGYDRRYGARPLKRAIEQTVLEPLAKIVSEAAGRSIQVELSLTEGAISWSVDLLEEEHEATQARALLPAEQGMELRRQTQKLLDSKPAHTLRNQLQRLHRVKSRSKRNPHLPEELQAELQTLTAKTKLKEALETLLSQSLALENKALLGLGGFEDTREELQEALDTHEVRIQELTVDLFSSNFLTSDSITVLVFPHRDQNLKPLINAYLALWKQFCLEVTGYRLSLGYRSNPEDPPDKTLRLPYGEELENRALCCEPTELERCLAQNPFGLAFELRGHRALALMVGEAGLHLFGSADAKPIEVVTELTPLKMFQPPEALHLPRLTVGIPKRRLYNHVQGRVEDLRLNLRKPWNGKNLEPLVSELVVTQMYQTAREACS